MLEKCGVNNYFPMYHASTPFKQGNQVTLFAPRELTRGVRTTTISKSSQATYLMILPKMLPEPNLDDNYLCLILLPHNFFTIT